MDRFFSLFGLYDVLGYLLSGLVLLVGVYWVFAGEVPELSTTALLGVLAAGYIAGQLAAVAGRAWEDRWWKRLGGEPKVRMIEGEDESYSSLQGKVVRERVEREVDVEGLDAEVCFMLAYAKLRMAGFHDRTETMLSLHGLCRNLAASSILVGALAAVVGIVEGWEPRLIATAAVGLTVGPLFAHRALRYQYRVSREVVLGFLALGMVEPEDEPAPA